MITIVLYFRDHVPVRFSGDFVECALQIRNAELHPGFLSWERVS